MADHFASQAKGSGSNKTNPRNSQKGQRYPNSMANGQGGFKPTRSGTFQQQQQQHTYHYRPNYNSKQTYKSSPNSAAPNHVNSLPTHPVGFSKSTPSPDIGTDQTNVLHSTESSQLPVQLPDPLDTDEETLVAPQQPSVVNNHDEENSAPAEETFHAVNNQTPSPPPDTEPQETTQPLDTDTANPNNPQNPSEARIDLNDPQQMAQMQAMMNNLYMSQMMMNPWMGMMPWMPIYPYQGVPSYLQAHPQAQYPNTFPIPAHDKQSDSDPPPKPDTPSSIPLQQADTFGDPDTDQIVSETSEAAPPQDSSSVALSDDPPPESCSPEPIASNVTQGSSPSSSQHPDKLSHSSLNEEPLKYDSTPAYPPELAHGTQLPSQADMAMGQLGVAVGSTLANCTGFGNWPNFSGPTPVQQLMRHKQIPVQGSGPGIISSAVLQVQQTNQIGATFGPFSPVVSLANPPPTTSQTFAMGSAPGATPQGANSELHSAPKSTALSSEASPQPSGFDNNTTAEPRNQHGIVEKESSSESYQSNEDDLESHEQEPTFIQLEVGGRTFQVHAASFENFPESKLYKIFHFTEPGSQNLGGAYTFDRDGNMFEVILSFVRTGRLDIPPYFSLKAIEREAEFFGMRDYMFEQGKQISPGSFFSFKRTLTLDMELQPGNDRQFQCIAVLDSADHLTFEEVVCEGFCHLLMEAVDLTGILIGRKIIYDNQDPNAWKGTQHSYEQKPVTVYLILIRKPSGGQPANTTSCKANITYSTVLTFDTESHLPGFYRR